MRRILNETELQRLRIGSIDPNEISDSLLELCAGSSRICHHFHIPLQSGSDSVLGRMGRPYGTAAFTALLERVVAAMPDAFIGTDIIAGFPGEDEEEFQSTCRLIELLPLADLHVFPYSRRPRTRAADMPDQVPPALIKERAARLRAIAGRKHEQFLQRAVGGELQVLVQHHESATGMVRGFPGITSRRNFRDRQRISTVSGGYW